MSVDDDAQRRKTLLGTLSDGEAGTLVRNPGSTLAPPHDASLGRRALEVLKTLAHDPNALVDHAHLAEGGMGVVQSARQVALDRQVAVKTLKPKLRSAHDIEALLAEAWRTGGLDHPNILPVYSLGLDHEGLPLLVMKRIEGVTWASLIRDPQKMAAHAPDRAALDEHLRILQQVCNALHYAHSRGVLHRDVKPDNVMVGAFGEVYVVDWGIACPPGPATQLAGTPAYMAPEMLGSAGGQLTPRTDVYLLGAVLFEVLSGRAPHFATNPQELFEVVLKSQPKLTTDAPEELASLCRACMSADPARRPASALEVRKSLEAFVEHQGSAALTRETAQRAEELRLMVADPNPDRAKVDGLFSASRFGFQMALAGWPGNQRARAELNAVLETMIRYELAFGSARAAQVLLIELDPNPELAAKVAEGVALEGEKDAKLERLKSLELSLDPRTGGWLRTTVAVAVGLLWVVLPGFGHFFLEIEPRYEMVKTAPIALISAVMLALVSLRGRRTESLMTPLNRQLLRTVMVAMLFQAVTTVSLFRAGLDVGVYGVGALAIYWGLVTALIASSILPGVWPTPLGYVACGCVAIVFPQWRHEMTMTASALMCVNVVAIARRQRYAAGN